MTNARLQFTLAVLLTLGILGLVAVMLLHPVTLSADAKAIVEGLIGQLVAVLVFVFHAIFAPHSNPTQAGNGQESKS